MTTNRYQHFLPAGFLKRFAINPGEGRRASVFVFDGERAFVDRVENVCKERDFYTPRRELEHGIHGEIESGLYEAVRGFLSGKPGAAITLRMLFHASYLAVRGPAFGNASGDDRLIALQKHGARFFLEHVLQLTPAEAVAYAHTVPAKVAKEWSFVHLTADASPIADTELFCSDTPTLILSHAGDPGAILLPLGPADVFVAARNARWRVAASTYSEADAGWLNTAQCRFAQRRLFSRRPLTNEERDGAARFMREERRPLGTFENSDLLVNSYCTTAMPSFLETVAA